MLEVLWHDNSLSKNFFLIGVIGTMDKHITVFLTVIPFSGFIFEICRNVAR